MSLDARAGLTGRTVLIVEDDPGVIDLVSLVLEECGCHVDVARTGEVALDRAERTRYDVLLLDLMLPDADGVILLGKMRKLAPGIGARTIFMTGFTRQEPVIDYLKSLGAGFIHKPFGPAELIRAVSSLG